MIIMILWMYLLTILPNYLDKSIIEKTWRNGRDYVQWYRDER